MPAPVRAVFLPAEEHECALQQVMSLDSTALCAAAWPLLPLDEQWRQLTDVYLPPPMRISASPKAGVQTFYDSINDSADKLIQQIGEYSFADDIGTAHRLRSVLFARALGELKKDVYDLAMPSSTAPSPATSGRASRVLPSSASAGRTTKGGSPDGDGRRGAARGGTRGAGEPATSTHPASCSTDRAAGPAGAANAVKTNSESADGRPAFLEVRKPHALIPRVLDESTPLTQVAADIDELVGSAAAAALSSSTAAGSAADDSAAGAAVTRAPDTAPRGSAVPDESVRAVLVHTAAQLALRARFLPRAADAFTELLHKLLECERALSSAESTATSRSGEGPSGATAPARGNERAVHASFVYYFLVPVLHLIAVVDWTPVSVQRIGRVLAAAQKPRAPGSSFGRGLTTATFTTTTNLSLCEFVAGRGAAAAAAIASTASMPEDSASQSVTESGGHSRPLPGEASRENLDEDADDGDGAGTSSGFHEIPEAAESSSVSQESEPYALYPDSANDEAGEHEPESGQSRAEPRHQPSLEDSDDESASLSSGAAASDGGSAEPRGTADGGDAVPLAAVETSGLSSARGTDGLLRSPAQASAAEAAQRVDADRPRRRTPPPPPSATASRTTVFRAPCARSVTVRVQKAIGCDGVLLLLMPLHPSLESADAVAQCEQPRTGGSYSWTGPCELQVVCTNHNSGGRTGRPRPCLVAEVTVDASLELDARWDLEWALAMGNAQRRLASVLLAHLRAAPSASVVDTGVDLPPAIFLRGLRSAGPHDNPLGVNADSAQLAPPHPFVLAVMELPDAELRLRTRCRGANVPGVRATLVTVAHFFTSLRDAEWNWRSPAWLDAVRRVSLASAALDKRVHAKELAQFIVDRVVAHDGAAISNDTDAALADGATSWHSPIVDAAISFFSRGNAELTPGQLDQELQERRELAAQTVVTLKLLQGACDQPASPRNLSLIAAAMKGFLMVKGHYMSTFTGAGLSLEGAIRTEVYATMERLFAVLRGVLARAAKMQGAPQRYLLQPWDYGPFAVLTVSLLASQLDKEDVRFINGGIASQVTSMLPDFTSLARTESFLVDEGDEVSFIKVFAEYFCDGHAEMDSGATGSGRKAMTSGGSSAVLLEGPRSPVGGAGDAMVTMVDAQFEKVNTFTSQSMSPFCHSREPVFSHEYTSGGGPRTFNLHLLNDHLSHFFIGLATPALSFGHPDVDRDPNGIYYLASGTLQLSSGKSKLPPLHVGDVVSLTFGFEATRWRIGLVLNGFLVASFVAPKQPLYLVLGTDNGMPHGAAFRGVFGRPLFMPSYREDGRDDTEDAAPVDADASLTLSPGSTTDPSFGSPLQSRLSPTTSTAAMSGTGSPSPPRAMSETRPGVVRGLPGSEGAVHFTSSQRHVRRLRLLCRGPHMKVTLYNVSLYTALVFHYLIVSCAKRQRHAPAAAAAATALISPAAPTTPMTRETEDVMRKCVDCCSMPLRRNVESLVRSITTLLGNAGSDQSAPAPSGELERTTAASAEADGAPSPWPAASAMAAESEKETDTTERVKRRTAALVYNNLLLDYTISLAVMLRSTSSPVEIMNVLTDVVCCPLAVRKTRSVALSALYNTVSMQNEVGAPGNGDGGFGILAFNPELLWNCCRQLAGADDDADRRPVFSSATVPGEIAVYGGGRHIAYKPGGPQRSGQRTTNYARDGIPLDGTRGETVSFSACLQRGFHAESLGRYYYVGVACCHAADSTQELTAHPGDRSRQFGCYFVTDFFADASDWKQDGKVDSFDSRAELKRHGANWFSQESGIVFGSGDVITATVHCRSRSVSFERNGRPLGVLFRGLPASVRVLYPFVELYNRDSVAAWMAPPNELRVHARYAMRALLRFWAPELAPRMRAMLTASTTSGDSTPLQILGADGDELSYQYQAPPRSEALPLAQDVRLIRTEAQWALVEDDSGATSRVAAAGLEPNHAAVMLLNEPLRSAFLADALSAVMALVHVQLPARTTIKIDHPAVLLRLLRYMTESEIPQTFTDGEDGTTTLAFPGRDDVAVPWETAFAGGEATARVPAQDGDAETQRLRTRAVELLLELLKVRTLDLAGGIILREAWTEICWAAASPSALVLPIASAASAVAATVRQPETQFLPVPQSPGARSSSSVKSCISVDSASSLFVTEEGQYRLLCPTCGSEWGQCTGGHPAPSNVCDLCDLVLRQFNQCSPYTGWLSEWRTQPPPAKPLTSTAPSVTTAPPMGSARTTAQAEEEDRGHAGSEAVAPSVVVPLASTRLLATEDSAAASTSAHSAPATPEEAGLAEGVEEEGEGEETAGADAADGAAEEEEEHSSDFTDYEDDVDGTAGMVGTNEDREKDVFRPVVFRVERVDGEDGGALAGVTRLASSTTTGAAVLVEGSGETYNGVFTFSGRLTSSTVLKGRITFKQGEPAPAAADADTVDAQAEWSCTACTFVNTPDATRCAICATPRPGSGWTCPLCSYAHNGNGTNMCAMCGQLRPGTQGGLRALLGLRPAVVDKKSYCEDCHAEREYRYFKKMLLYQLCDRCGEVTRWLPKDRISGVMEARLVGDGDQLEFSWSVDGAVDSVEGLRTTGCTAAQLRQLVRERVPPVANELGRYVPPLIEAEYDTQVGGGRGGRSGAKSPESTSCLSSAIAYYASRLVLLWGPSTNPEIFTNADVLTRLLVLAEDWLEPLRCVPLAAAANILHTCLSMLLTGAEGPQVIQTISSAARVLMRANPSLREQRHYLLYALGLTAMRTPNQRTREVCYSAVSRIFEDSPLEVVNGQCLGPALSRQPVVAGQQCATVHALLRRVSAGDSAPVGTKAASCLVRAILNMESQPSPKPLPRVLDGDMAMTLPHVVALAETRMNEGGQLQVGQARGSVGNAPTKGGCYYYEVVLPPNYADTSNTVVMGWGTVEHERLSSSQHVGSDLHSWGFNCRDRLRLMMGEQLISVPQRPVAGDVIGSMMNLETMMVSWSVNGEELTWVSVPAQGESEEIYPFVSASVEPGGVEIRLGSTQFKPPDYEDYSAPTDVQLWSETSGTAPQPYGFYRQLCTMADSLSIIDLRGKASVLVSLSSAAARRALAHAPLVSAFVHAHQEQSSGPELDMACLWPYIQHLGAISDLTVMAARNYAVLKESPFLSECYLRARDLLLSSARWVIFETQIGGRPTFNASRCRTVKIDLEKARRASDKAPQSAAAGGEQRAVLAAEAVQSGDAAAEWLEEGRAVASEQTAFTESVTGQLFAQVETAPIYKDATMFTVQLVGDKSVDAGGVTRSILSLIADELTFSVRGGLRADPAVPLFKLCGHSTIFTVVPNMERLLFESDDTEEEAEGGGERLCHRMLTWLGLLMGNLALCGTMKLPLTLPRIAWKYLTFSTPTIEDYYYDVDDSVKGSLADDAFLLNDEYFFSIPGVLQLEPGVLQAPLHPPTASVASAMSAPALATTGATNALSAASASAGNGGAAAHKRLGLARPLRPYSCMTPAVSMMDLAQHLSRTTSRANLSAVLPLVGDRADSEDDDAAAEVAAASLQAREACRRRQAAEHALLHQYDAAFQCMRNGLVSVLSQTLVRTIRWDDLQTRVCGTATVLAEQVIASLDWVLDSEDLRVMLCQMLRDMTETERSQFLLFCSGQSRLPLPERISVVCGDEPALVPTAHTCSPISLRLQPYRSVEEMRAKFDLCLSNATQFGLV